MNSHLANKKKLMVKCEP